MRKAEETLHFQFVHPVAVITHQPAPDLAKRNHVRNVGSINGWLTYVMFEIVENIRESFVPNVIHEWAFLWS
jgi:hypothetical protein